MLDDPRLDWKLLEAYGFDRARFSDAARRIREGTLSEKTAVLEGARIEPYRGATAVSFEDQAMRARGEAALRAGEVASVVLNGGMSTRFGSVVKGTFEVYDGKSFIALKGEDVRRAAKTYGAPVPLVFMNSFATRAQTMEHLAGLEEPMADFLSFHQSISIRMNPDGTLFVGGDGKPSYHAPGHGDFFPGIRGAFTGRLPGERSVLEQLRARGVKTVLFANVDNLGATVDPTVIGYHLASGADMSAEVTAKRRTASGAWDKGGSAALVDGRLQLVEGFRFPPNVQDTLPDFSTNNFLFRLDALDQEIPLERHVVRKSVEGRPALQLESIACEASAARRPDGTPLLSLNILLVPRDGPHGRFFPVKEREDLDAQRDVLRDRLAQGWASRDRR